MHVVAIPEQLWLLAPAVEPRPSTGRTEPVPLRGEKCAREPRRAVRGVGGEALPVSLVSAVPGRHRTTVALRPVRRRVRPK